MVRAAGSKLGKTGSVFGVHEAQDFCVVLDRRNEALLFAHLTAEPRQKGCEHLLALFFRKSGLH
jgi:hypothetical protein